MARRPPSLALRLLRMWLALIVGLYFAVVFFAWFYGDQAIFLPHPSSYPDDERVIKLTTADGVRISAMHFPAPGARYTLLFSHGNAEDIGDNLDFFRALNRAGFSVFAYDYRGYGTSEGTPTEQGAYRDEEAAYRYLVDVLKLPPERIVAHGRSVGSGPAVDLASNHPVGGLIIESGFTSAFTVVTRWTILPIDKFNNVRKIAQVRAPVLIIHGTDDEVISHRHALALYARAPEPKKLVSIEGARHNDLLWVAGQRYYDTLKDFEKTLAAHEATGDKR